MDSIQRNLSYCGEAKGTKDTEVLNRMEDELQLAGEEIEYLEINIQEKNMKCLEQEEKNPRYGKEHLQSQRKLEEEGIRNSYDENLH